jgi:hypothetical protein
MTDLRCPRHVRLSPDTRLLHYGKSRKGQTSLSQRDILPLITAGTILIRGQVKW